MTDKTTKELMRDGFYFPRLHINGETTEERSYVKVSTLVRVFREGKWYVLLIVQPLGSFAMEHELLQVMTQAYKIQHLWKLRGTEVIDDLQISEEERLRNLENQT